jgi:endonuclease/exonuclease/phosphatase family metal-dependent hydrolase
VFFLGVGFAATLQGQSPIAVGEVELLDALRLPVGQSIDSTPVGGLSGLTYDRTSDRFWVVSDDRSERAPARLLRMRLAIADGRLTADDVEFEAALFLRDQNGALFARRSLDPEGVALSSNGFFVSSEGESKAGVPPFVAEFDREGKMRRRAELPARFLPAGDGTRGVRDNLGFEALSTTENRATLLFATEGPLVGDGPAADVDTTGVARVRRVDVPTGRAEEFFYPLDAVSVAPTPRSGFRVNGLSDLLALDRNRFLALERQFAVGVGHRVRLFLVDLSDATDVSGLDGPPGPQVRRATKRLVFDFKDLGIEVANFEGLAFGPRLADGRTTLVMLSDDNFREFGDDAWLLLLALDADPPSVAEVQGALHRSPREGRHVLGLEGVVTAVDRKSRVPVAWIESPRPDGRQETSEGLALSCPEAAQLSAGTLIVADGRIEERAANASQLSVTTLACSAVHGVGQASLPPPVALWGSGRDALSLWESLESMRVAVPAGVVAGATKSYGEVVLLPRTSTAPRTTSGSTRVPPDRPWLERAMVSGRLAGGMPELSVGSLVEATEGVVDYGFGNYRVLATRAIEARPASGRCAEATSLRSRRGRVTVASYNVENLSLAGDAARFVALASDVVDRLGAPEILAVQEVQDDDGPGALGGPTTSRGTLERWVEEIVRHGGPRYVATWIDPDPDREGGQPGGNIRVALLHDPRRVELVRRGQAGPRDAVRVLGMGRSTHLSLSPGRIAPESIAFSLLNTEGVRRSLVAEFEVGGRSLFVVVNHWSSKYADDRLFGARQPPQHPTERFRLAQAQEVRAFIDSLLQADAGAAVIALGDFNDVEDSAPLRELSRPPLFALSSLLDAADRYSYEFEGNGQLIDHVVVSPTLSHGAEFDIVHRNADCPDTERTSDHDPLIARLRLRR